MSTRNRRVAPIAVIECLECRQLLAFALIGTNIQTTAQTLFSGRIATLGSVSTTFSPGQVTISWGDGTPNDTTTGQVVPVDPLSIGNVGVLEVVGTHTYTAPGSYTVKVTVVDASDGQTVSATLTASVGVATLTLTPNAVTGASGFSLSAGNHGNPVTVANFLDPVLTDMASGFTAVIEWGDGTSSPGKVGGSKGVFSITGDHKYNLPPNTPSNSYTFTVTVVGYGENQSVSGTATISAGAPSNPTNPYQMTPVPIAVPASQTPTTIVVARLVDPNATTTSASPDSASNFVAVITWGDGGTSVGVVQEQAVTAQGTSFTISGDYAYTTPGTYPVAVTVTNTLTGQAASTSTTANVVNTANGPGVNPYAFTIGLAPLPANGPNAANGFSMTNEPVFAGTAPPFAVVQLTARRVDIDANLSLGQTVANGAGQWSFGTDPLAEGIYQITATVTPPGGSPQQETNPAGSSNSADQFVIDTSVPVVAGVTLLGQSGRVLVTFLTGQSGMDQATITNAANYTFYGPNAAPFHPAAVALGPVRAQTPNVESVVLTMGGTPRARHLVHDLSLDALAITSEAGESLQTQGNASFALVVPHAASPRLARKARH